MILQKTWPISLQPVEPSENNYSVFGKDGGKHMSNQNNLQFLGETPLIKSIADSGDNGLLVVLDAEEAVTEIDKHIASRKLRNGYYSGE